MGSPRGLVVEIAGRLAWRRPRRVMCQGARSQSGMAGMFTLSSQGPVPGGRASTCSTTRRATVAAVSRWAQPLSVSENAMEGTPNRKPSVAAATVPE